MAEGIVLIVDDQAESREVMATALVDEGYSVIEASDGAEALELLVSPAGREPDCIVLDLRMPVMTGWDFLEIVSHYDRLAKIPVIVTSAAETTHERVGRAVVRYFAKPVDLSAMLAAVQEQTADRPLPSR